MPIQLEGGVSGRSYSGKSSQAIEKEISLLRSEMDALRSRLKQDSAHGFSESGSLLGWITMGMAVFGVALGLIALLRH